ncbi:argininosuccinate lyase [Dethiobacter alkaliphilus]|uniref:Argininosuccinate lyase n=1 Tax=Dethiobacter alkaliphilus AHT 1 TaxID=555088 RepID=C0GH84_DETAL|nr:argininosuccinate lyase [Dethiobacter alkaliphilus]EEG77386.1 argininosuccinate lyase [Dethiobacter alkaliphilus AHT 1]
MKLWGGRFAKETDALVEEFNASIPFDKRLYEEDIRGSMAHCRMLANQGIICGDEAEQILAGLAVIKEEMDRGEVEFSLALEDIHMHVEKRLTEKIGPVGGKLHTGRSRNDQVALDMHMYVKKEILETVALIGNLQEALVNLAEDNLDAVMPGYTHLQRAQPVLFAHHLLAYFWMLQRDRERFLDSFGRADWMPLGAGALAGTTFPVDREMVASELGFAKLYENSMDAVSDRDFVLEFLSNSAIMMTHLSRLSEDIIIWNSQEFGFITLDDAFTTGSSIMPQKKNPDVAELVRGKTGRVYGHLMGLLTVLKGLPLAYNKDMQEDKEGLFDTVDTIKICLRLYAAMLRTVEPNKERMYAAVARDFASATDLADYLVRKGLPFREAHAVVGQLVGKCVAENRQLVDLTTEELTEACSHFEDDAKEMLPPEACVEARQSRGGTARSEVEVQIRHAKSLLINENTK